MESKTPKEIFISKISRDVEEFEKQTGVEVQIIKIHRIELTEIDGSYCCNPIEKWELKLK